MENQFSQFDIMLIEKEIPRKTYADIAFLIDRPVEEVTAYISDLAAAKSIITYQMVKDQNKKPAVVKERAPRPKKEKKEKEKKITSAITSSRIVRDNTGSHIHRERRHYKTREIDFSKMVTVRIDDRTQVLAHPDEDPTEVRRKYHENVALSKQPFRTGGVNK